MLLREILTEQDQSKTVSTTGEKILYHSTTYEKAYKLLTENALQVNLEDHGYDIAKDAFVSFSRSSNNLYNRDVSDTNVTFEIDQEKLKRQLHGRSHRFGPFSFSNFHRDELECRLDLKGKCPVKNLNKFVRAIHIVPDRTLIKIAEFEAGEIPSTAPDGTPLDVETYKKRIALEKEAYSADIKFFKAIIELAEQRKIRQHVYPDRKSFLNKVVNKSVMPRGIVGKGLDLIALVLSRGKTRRLSR